MLDTEAAFADDLGEPLRHVAAGHGHAFGVGEDIASGVPIVGGGAGERRCELPAFGVVGVERVEEGKGVSQMDGRCSAA